MIIQQVVRQVNNWNLVRNFFRGQENFETIPPFNQGGNSVNLEQINRLKETEKFH